MEDPFRTPEFSVKSEVVSRDEHNDPPRPEVVWLKTEEISKVEDPSTEPTHDPLGSDPVCIKKEEEDNRIEDNYSASSHSNIGVEAVDITKPLATRYTNVGEHLPEKLLKNRRCAHCSSQGIVRRSLILCRKCQVALCLECFIPFHTY